MTLNCTGSSRLNWVGPILSLDRTEPPGGALIYSLPLAWKGSPAGTLDKAKELDALGVPLDIGRSAAVAALRAAGHKPGRFEVL